MKKKILWSVLFVGILATLAIGTTGYAAEHGDEATSSTNGTEGGIQVVIEPVSVEEQEQVALQAIAQQLQELEAEVNRLSLVVSKYVLEQQALALQRQLLETMPLAAGDMDIGKLETIAVLPTEGEAMEGAMMEEGGVAMVEEEGAVAIVEEVTSPISEPPPPSQEDVFESITIESDTSEQLDLDELPVPIVASDDEDGGQGFLAGIRSAVGNLGTPEFVTVFILAVLAIFVIARRVASRGRGGAAAPAAKPSPSEGNAPTQSKTQETGAQPEGQSLDQQRQELQERVAWK